MFAGIYYGAMYGGSTTSILLNTPGESASVATSIEGYQMARRGRARAALATAAIGSFVAATISTILLSLVAVPIATLAVKFRARDYFALAVLAMVAVTALVGRSLIRGMLSLFFGLVDRARRHRQRKPVRRGGRLASSSCSTASRWPSSSSACSPSARRSTSPPGCVTCPTT